MARVTVPLFAFYRLPSTNLESVFSGAVMWFIFSIHTAVYEFSASTEMC